MNRTRIGMVIAQGVAARKRKYGMGAAGLLVLALFMYVVGLLAGDALIGLLFAAVPLFLGVIMGLVWLALGDPQRSKFMRLLTERTKDLVWVYDVEITQRMHGLDIAKHHNIWIYCADRKGAVAPVPANMRAELMFLLAEELPHATIGWNEHRLATFRSDPEALRRKVAPATMARASSQPRPASPAM